MSVTETHNKRVTAKYKALIKLRSLIREGDMIYTVRRFASAEYCAFNLYVATVVDMDSAPGATHLGLGIWRVTALVASVIGFRYDKKLEAIGIGGAPTDPEKLVVQELSLVLFGDRFFLNHQRLETTPEVQA